MNSLNSSRTPIWKMFGKLRNLIIVEPQADAPWRSWDRASSREIQLEFDFEQRKRCRETKGNFKLHRKN